MKILKEEKLPFPNPPCFCGLTPTPLVATLEFQAYFLYFLQKKFNCHLKFLIIGLYIFTFYNLNQGLVNQGMVVRIANWSNNLFL
jgi:hypothetical protein